MKHRISGKQLGRNRNQRQALIKGLAKSIFTYGAIQTTEAKAKAVIPMIEKLASTAMKDTLVCRRELFKIFQNQTFVNNVVDKMKAVFGDQKSNFTKVTKIKRRQGDDALVVSLSFVKPVDFTTVKKAETKEEPKKESKPKKTVKKAKTTK